MLQNVIRLVFTLVILMISQASWSASYPACDATLNVDGAPSAPIMIAANGSLTLDLTVTGGTGLRPEYYAIEWVKSPVAGKVDVVWQEPVGTVRKVKITYTASNTFTPGTVENILFRFKHTYGDVCFSRELLLSLYNEQCNGIFSLDATYVAPVTVDWGAKYPLSVDVSTNGYTKIPNYNMVMLQSPTTGAIESPAFSARPDGAAGKQLSFTFAHAMKTYGTDSIRFRIEDNAISDAAARAACGKEVTINLNINPDPTSSCSTFEFGMVGVERTLNTNFGVYVAEVDKGTGFFIRVMPSNSTATNPSYSVSYDPKTQLYGKFYPNGTSTTNPEFLYQHDSRYDVADTLTVVVTETVGGKVTCTKSDVVHFVLRNSCVYFGADALPSDTLYINPSDTASFSLKLPLSTGPYSYEVVSLLNNGKMDTMNSGNVDKNEFTFNYQHNGDPANGDEVVVKVSDVGRGCVAHKKVIITPDVCAGLTMGQKIAPFVKHTTGGIKLTAGLAPRGSRKLVFKIDADKSPTQGEVGLLPSGELSPDESDSNSISYTFNYTHTGNDIDTFNVIAYDPVYPHCQAVSQVTVEFCTEFKEYFTTYLSPSPSRFTGDWPYVDKGGTASITALTGGGSGKYSYKITRNPLYGTIVKPSSDIPTTSTSFRFDYKHNGIENQAQEDTFEVTIKDEVNGCMAAYDATIRIFNCGASKITSVTPDSIDKWGYRHLWSGIDKPTVFWIEIPYGSGDYEFTPEATDASFTMATIPIKTLHREVDGTKVRQYFSIEPPKIGTYQVEMKARDKVLDTNTKSCKGHIRYYYDIRGSQDNLSCKTLSATVSGIYEQASNLRTSVDAHKSIDFSVKRTGGDNARKYDFSAVLMDANDRGTITVLGQDEASTVGYLRYTAGSFAGYRWVAGTITDRDDPLCVVNTSWYPILIKDPSNTCNGNFSSGADGTMIFDNTANKGLDAIQTNLNFVAGCSKSESTIGVKSDASVDENGQGINVINTPAFKMVNQGTWGVNVSVGSQYDAISKNLLQSESGRLDYFGEGRHLFDLDRLRVAADWLSSRMSQTQNVTPKGEVSPNTYGTITMQQFLENIRDGKVMYGITRVLVGLEKGGCKPNCRPEYKNSLGEIVNEENLYGFCAEGNTEGLCACAPSTRANRTFGAHFDTIKVGAGLCKDSKGDPMVLPSLAKIMVKGTLLWDFVDYRDKDADGNPKRLDAIALADLPFYPRDLYYMVDVPIIVNSAFNDDYCGGKDYTGCTTGYSTSLDFRVFMNRVKLSLDHMFYNPPTSTTPVETKPFRNYFMIGVPYIRIAETSKTEYFNRTGKVFDQAAFDALLMHERFHMMMPTGYSLRWAEAFDKLNLTAETWKSLGFGIPAAAPTGGPLPEKWIQNDEFEDLPVYLYSGGLIDMHSHVYISGLVYVPQAAEIEAEAGSNINQYIVGAMVVRDGFYLAVKNNSTMVISADPDSYYSAVTTIPGNESSSSSPTIRVNSGPLDVDVLLDGAHGGSSLDPSLNGLGGGGDDPALYRKWQKIFPQ